jgi:hypothetical protein
MVFIDHNISAKSEEFVHMPGETANTDFKGHEIA